MTKWGWSASRKRCARKRRAGLGRRASPASSRGFVEHRAPGPQREPDGASSRSTKMRDQISEVARPAEDIADAIALRGRPARAGGHQRDPDRPRAARERAPAVAADQTNVRDNVQGVSVASDAGERGTQIAAAPRSGPRVRALREAMGLSLRDLAERSGVSRADALAGRARRDQPDARRRRADRRRPRAAASPSCCASTRAATWRSCAPASAARRQRRRGHRDRGAHAAAARASAPTSRATARAGRDARAGPATRRCTSRAAARPRSCSSGAVTLDCRRRAPRPGEPATASPSTPTCRTTSRTPATTTAELLAVVAAGLRRS